MLVLGIQGSPRKDGNTALIMSEFMDEVKNLGVEIELIDISEKRIQPCKECNTCENKGFCPINDDMQDIYRLFVKSDLIVMATPMFFYAPPAQLKAMIDRTQALWSRKYIFGLSDPGRLWRKAFMIALGATKGKNLFEGANLIAKYFFDAIGAEYTGFLGYRKVEKKGDILKHPKAISEVREKAKYLMKELLKKKKVLFVSEENAAVIQMAYAFTRLYFGNKLDVKNVMISPAKGTDLLVIEAMADKGIDMYYLKPQSIDEVLHMWKPDLIIDIKSGEKQFNISDISVEHWDIPDIQEKSIDSVRKVRDEIEKK